MQTLRLLPLLLITLIISACTATGINSGTPADRRLAILEMREAVYAELFEIKPDVRSQLNSAAGHAVFSNANINLIFASFGGGRGVVQDNATGEETFMRMGEVGIGLGAGVKDFRAVFIFHDQAALSRFVDEGWSFGGQADVAVKAGDLGAAASGEAILDNVSIYQLTQSGLALQATLKGTRYWKDSDLN
jgi:lipid-binding SYLF domain-containing protein